jgi:hypothetical protein
MSEIEPDPEVAAIWNRAIDEYEQARRYESDAQSNLRQIETDGGPVEPARRRVREGSEERFRKRATLLDIEETIPAEVLEKLRSARAKGE